MENRKKLLEEIKKCSTREELNGLLTQNSVSLPLSVLEHVTGGTKVDGGYVCDYCNQYFDGNVKGYFDIVYHYVAEH